MPRRREDIQADLLDLAAEPTPGASLRERILGGARSVERFEGFVARLSDFLDLSEGPTRALLDSIRASYTDAWQETSNGVRVKHFAGGPRHAEAHCGLVQIEPGASFPMHRHVGDEWVFVVQGEGREDDGTTWHPGDLLRNPADSRHAITSVGTEPLVFLAAAHHGIEREE